MNKRQRALLLESVIVLGAAVVVLLVLLNLKDWTNRREALRAMAYIAAQIQAYQQTHGSLPPSEHLDRVRATAPGRKRLGKLEYRIQDIEANSPDTALLAYAKQTYHSLLVRNGYIVIHLNGQVSWMTAAQFQSQLPH